MRKKIKITEDSINKEDDVTTGDRVVLLYMPNESLTVGTEGTVTSSVNTRYGKIIKVKWDNGSNFSLVDGVDLWKKIDNNSINESFNHGNDDLKEGDRVMCLHMHRSNITVGTKGTVTSVTTFSPTEKIIGVDWDNGSKLNLLSDLDLWKKIDDDSINESSEIQKDKLEVGDRVMLLYAPGESTIVGTKGTVVKISPDDDSPNEHIFMVEWDNGELMGLLSEFDMWKKIEKEKIDESHQLRQMDFLIKNEDLLNHFEFETIIKYLNAIRNSGIINMFGVSPLLYCGKEHIERYYGENPPDEESFEDVLELADVVKNKMISGTINMIESEGTEVSLELVNRRIKNYSDAIRDLWMVLH